jgi:hypothetical protein
MSRSVGLLCRRHAEECLRMADQTDSPETRSILIMMAGAWHRLAQEREDTERLVADVEAAAPGDGRLSRGLSRPSLPAGQQTPEAGKRIGMVMRRRAEREPKPLWIGGRVTNGDWRKRNPIGIEQV